MLAAQTWLLATKIERRAYPSAIKAWTSFGERTGLRNYSGLRVGELANLGTPNFPLTLRFEHGCKRLCNRLNKKTSCQQNSKNMRWP